MLGTAQLKTAIVRRLRAQFNTAAVPYIPTDWNTIIQAKPVANTPYPYIHVEIDDNEIEEVAVTATGSSYDYFVSINAVTRSEVNADFRQTRDAMITEIQRILDVDYDEYLNLTSNGFNVYIQTVESVSLDELNEMGTDFYSGTITLKVRMEAVGSQTSPEIDVTTTLAGFTHEPVNGKYELHDGGTVTLPTTYPMSNGWIFQSVDYSLASDSDGTLSGNVATIAPGDDLLAISTVVTFESALDSSVTTTVFSRTTLEAVKSPRIAAINTSALTTAQITDLSLWSTYFSGSTNPNRVEVEVTGNASDYIYVLIDDDYTLTGIKNDLGLEDIDEYTESTQDGYKVYKLTNALNFGPATFEYTLISGALPASSDANDVSVNVKILSVQDSSLEINTANVIPTGLSGLLMPLPANPSPGDIVHISNLSGEITNEVQLNGNILNGLYSDNLILDDETSSFSLVFINLTLGWNIIGQN